MPEGTTTNKVVQLKDPTTKEPVSPVVNVGSIYDKNGNKVDNLLSYKVAGTDVTIPELADVAGDLQAQVDEKLAEVDEALAESLGDISTPAQKLGLPSNASVGDLFNTLASVGDLHVWRRTTSSGVDYPVSTEQNAYQEGSDAKPAGYTKGSVNTGSFKFGQYPVPYNGLAVVRYYYSSSVEVSDDGTVSLFDEIPKNVGYDYDLSVLKGKYIRIHDDESQFVSFFKPGKIYYIPPNATFSQTGSTMDWETTVDKYQTVTGYAAIPADTTIEYLGNLGDKSRIATGSYVGTGLQGEGNKTVVPFPFPVKFAVVYSLSGLPAPGGNGWENMLIYTEGMLLTKISGEYVYFQLTENSLKFYCDGLASDQLNELGTEYCFFGIA